MDIGASGNERTEQTRPVVVGVDGSACAESALRYALSAAARRGTDLEVVSAFAPELFWAGGAPLQIPDTDAIRADTETRARDLVEQVRTELAEGPVAEARDVPVRVVAAAGPAAAVLTDRAGNAELLVVGNRGRGAVRSAVLGSVALHCVTHARCPVLVCHAMSAPPADPPRIVVGVDGSQPARAALAAAVEEAARTGAAVEVVASYVPADYWTDMYSVLIPTLEQIRDDVRRGTEELVDSVLAGRTAGTEALAVHVSVAEGAAQDVLLQHARGADLLIVGSRGRGSLRGLLLGSVALHCAMHAPCPVMVVHPAADRTTDAAAEHAEPATADR